MVGMRIGNYRVLRQIGRGGMGAVFEAVNDGIGKRVAIKVLHPHFAQDPHIAGRFNNEARLAGTIHHPGIVQIFDFGQIEGASAYLVMEFLQGEPLNSRIRRVGMMPTVEVLRIGRQLATALAAAHALHVVHRDLKPSNIILVPDPEAAGGERAKIVDFGIAKIVQDAETERAEDEEASFHTHNGALVGTPTYMSPEQCRGDGNVDERSDVYSLGVLFYHMLAGHPPFTAKGDGAVLAMHIYEEPPPLSEVAPAVMPQVGGLVARMLAKNPQARPSMEGVARELEGLGAKLSSSISVVGALAALPLPAVVTVPGEGTMERPPSQASPSYTAAGFGVGEQQQQQPTAGGRLLWLLGLGAAAGGLMGAWAILRPERPMVASVAMAPPQREVPAVEVLPLPPPAPAVPLQPTPEPERRARPRPKPRPLAAAAKATPAPVAVAPPAPAPRPVELAPPTRSTPVEQSAPPAPVVVRPPPPTFSLPRKLSGDNPRLPEGFRQSARGTSSVELRYKLCISTEGRVTKVERLEGVPVPDQDIVATLQRWTFAPLASPACTLKTFRYALDE